MEMATVKRTEKSESENVEEQPPVCKYGFCDLSLPFGRDLKASVHVPVLEDDPYQVDLVPAAHMLLSPGLLQNIPLSAISTHVNTAKQIAERLRVDQIDLVLDYLFYVDRMSTKSKIVVPVKHRAQVMTNYRREREATQTDLFQGQIPDAVKCTMRVVVDTDYIGGRASKQIRIDPGGDCEVSVECAQAKITVDLDPDGLWTPGAIVPLMELISLVEHSVNVPHTTPSPEDVESLEDISVASVGWYPAYKIGCMLEFQMSSLKIINWEVITEQISPIYNYSTFAFCTRDSFLRGRVQELGARSED